MTEPDESFSGGMVPPLVAPLVHEAAVRGVPAADLLRALGLEASQLGDREVRIPTARVVAAWDIAMRGCRDPELPIAAGRHATVEGFGVLGYALYTARTAKMSLEALGRYHDVINDSGRWHLSTTDALCTVAWERRGDRVLGLRAANEQVLASFIALADRITPTPVQVVRVSFRHPAPRNTGAHERHFRGPITWEAEQDAIVCDASFLSDTPRGFDPVTTTYFAHMLQREQERAGPSGSWRQRAAGIVGAMLPSGLPTLESVASELGTSGRTLRRRLAEEDVRFEKIMVELQRARADTMIDRGEPLREVAFAVGYADLSAFSRAYKRWTGIAPSARRKR